MVHDQGRGVDSFLVYIVFLILLSGLVTRHHVVYSFNNAWNLLHIPVRFYCVIYS